MCRRLKHLWLTLDETLPKMIQEIGYLGSTTSSIADSICGRCLLEGSAPDVKPGQLPLDLELCGVLLGIIPRRTIEPVHSRLIERICQGRIGVDDVFNRSHHTVDARGNIRTPQHCCRGRHVQYIQILKWR